MIVDQCADTAQANGDNEGCSDSQRDADGDG